jgi:Uma2 family endonuclease
MGLAQEKKRFTPQEYYQLERAATYKSDYYRGEIFAMAGGTIRHSRICTNIVREVGIRLKGSPCEAFESSLRLKNKITGLRNYPDASIFCGPMEYDEEDPEQETVTNPTVIFEVLSKSTEAYDRGLKSQNYRRIESLQAYILVSQNMPFVEVLQRQADGSWSIREVTGIGASLNIPPLGIDLPLAEIYANVDFLAEDSDSTAGL